MLASDLSLSNQRARIDARAHGGQVPETAALGRGRENPDNAGVKELLRTPYLVVPAKSSVSVRALLARLAAR